MVSVLNVRSYNIINTHHVLNIEPNYLHSRNVVLFLYRMMYTKITAFVHMMHVCRVSSVVQASKVSGDMETVVSYPLR